MIFKHRIERSVNDNMFMEKYIMEIIFTVFIFMSTLVSQ